MWKRGGRSSALDRAEALLSAKRTSGGFHTGAVGGSVKTRSASLNAHPLFSDLSELSSVSSAPEHGADTMLDSAAAAGKTLGREGLSTKDLRPQSSLGGVGARFLKKALPPASQSPVSKSQIQQVPEHRNVSSSQRGSQMAALTKLAQIESCIRRRKQVQERAGQGPNPAESLTSDVGISPKPASRSPEAPVQLSARSGSDQSLKGKRFLKNKATTLVKNSNTADAGSQKGADVGVRSGSRAADDVGPSARLETKSVRVVSRVSLESDEEDMRKLLGDSLESVDDSFVVPGRPSSMLRKSSQKVHSSPPPTAVVPPSSSCSAVPPRSPASPPRRNSPFRFAGQAQAHFSPSVLSPSPSPPHVSPLPPGRVNSPHRTGSPWRSLSMSGLGEVLSLEELFSEDPHSEMSAVTSEDGQQDFKINVMTLDDLVPATFGFTEETRGKEREVKDSVPPPGSGHQQYPRLKEEEVEKEEQGAVLDYQGDFESETEPDDSVSQVSEHLQGDRDDEEEAVLLEVREEASDPDVSCGRTEGDYSSAFSDTSRSCTSRTSDHSQRLHSSRDSRSSSSHGSRTSSRPSRRRTKVLKEAAVQTQPDPLAYAWPDGLATLGPAAGMTCMDPTPVVAHTLSAEIVEALSTSNPAVFALNEMLKQQLAMTRRFMESSRRLHSGLVRSLGPPSYRYTTLEDIKENICKHRPPKLTMEEALEEVLQEMRDYHRI